MTGEIVLLKQLGVDVQLTVAMGTLLCGKIDDLPAFGTNPGGDLVLIVVLGDPAASAAIKIPDLVLVQTLQFQYPVAVAIFHFDH